MLTERLLSAAAVATSRATLTIIACAMLYVPASAADGAETDGALNLVKVTTERLLRAVTAEGDRVRQDPNRALALVDEHVSPHVDLERSSRWVLGKHWRRATALQRDRFIQEFRTLLMRTYATAVAEYRSVNIVYLPVRRTTRPDEAIVRTEIPKDGARPLSIQYRLHGSDAGGWKLFDVSIEGISLVSTYRASFSQRVKQRGIDGLIDDLAAKNRENAGV